MTEKRLKQLRKQHATVWIDCPINSEFCEIELDNSYKIDDVGLYNRFGMGYSLQWVFETKERAEWHRKTHTQRVDTFEPPIWDDIDKIYTFDWFNQGCHYRLAVDKSHNYIIVINFTSVGDIFDEPATKENYEKACEMVRKLFKGVK